MSLSALKTALHLEHEMVGSLNPFKWPEASQTASGVTRGNSTSKKLFLEKIFRISASSLFFMALPFKP